MTNNKREESIFDSEILNSRYFFPRKEEFPDPFWVECNGERLSCYYHLIDPAAKTVIFFHGNGEIVADYIDFLLPIFTSLECNCFLAEYRGYAMSSGQPALVAMLKDVEAIIKAINLPLNQLIIFGRSIGSIFAIHGAYRFPEISGLILESGVANVLDRILLRASPEELGVPSQRLEEEAAAHLNQQQKLRDFKGSSLIMHARGDTLLDVSNGQKLFQWAPQPKKLKIFDHGDHNSIFPANSQAYIEELAAFISQIRTDRFTVERDE